MMRTDVTRCENEREVASRLLWFRYEGGPLQDVQIAGNGCDVLLERFGRWAGVLLRDPVDPGGAIELVADGASRVTTHRFIRQDEMPTPAPPPELPRGAPLPSWPTAEREWPVASAARVETDAAGRRRRLLRHLETASYRFAGAGEERSRWSALFWYLDHNTHPELLAGGDEAATTWPWRSQRSDRRERARSIRQLSKDLSARVQRRLALTRAGTDLRVIQREVRNVAISDLALNNVSWIVSRIVGAYGAIEGDAAAFEAFATGKLRCRRRQEPNGPFAGLIVTEGCPDSPSIFLFAELAIAAIAFGMQETFWRAFLPVAVAMLPSYCKAFGNGGRGTVSDYLRNGSAWERIPRPVDAAVFDETLEELRGCQDGEVERRLGVYLDAALAGDFVLDGVWGRNG